MKLKIMSSKGNVINNSSLQISGQVEKVTYYNPENGFCIIKLKMIGKKELVSVLGVMPGVSSGEKVEATGIWEKNSIYGESFKAQSINTTLPTSLKGIEKYLSSGIIKGVGPAFAKKLIKKFGQEVFIVIEQQPEKLMQIDGFTTAKVESITSNWDQQKTIREIVLFLHSYNINSSKAVMIYNIYGAASIKTIEDNPYKLAHNIKGIGFDNADLIAQNLGVAKDSIIRARAGISHALTKATEDGHCGLPTNTLIENTQKLLAISEELIRKALELELTSDNVVKYALQGQNNASSEECIFPKTFVSAEAFIGNKLLQISKQKKSWPQIANVERLIKNEAAKLAIELSISQKQAIVKAFSSSVLIITGGPGVGKTTILNIIVKILENKGVKILLAAPTGRAAKRIAEITGAPATTIHRLLKKNIDEDWHAHITLKCDLLIIDEMSMIDVHLMDATLKSLPENAKIFLFGDIDQLPSIGAGRVLADLIESSALPVVKLTEIFRQSNLSQIIANAHKINNGELPSLVNNKEGDFFFIEISSQERAVSIITDLVKNRLPKKYELSPTKDIQVLCPMNKGMVGTLHLNEKLQKALIEKSSLSEKCTNLHGTSFYLGDKVMQLINNYDLEIFNGDIGIIINIDARQRIVTVNYDGRHVAYEYKLLDEITLAYAITIHKSQGSEYPVVIIPLFIQHYPMLQKNVLYTAISRGKKLVIIVGEKKAVAVATENKLQKSRYTSLKQKLMNLAGI